MVGVSWSQAQAFCDWRTALKLSGTDPELRVFETAYRLQLKLSGNMLQGEVENKQYILGEVLTLEIVRVVF